MAKDAKHQPNTTTYRDHGAETHDHQTEWTKDDSGRIVQTDKHVDKGTGGGLTEKVGK
jgi:hypothetical protein